MVSSLYGMEIVKKHYLIRYQGGNGYWYMVLVHAWDAYTAVSIIQRLRHARQVDRPALIREEQLNYYRENLKMEEVN